MDTILSGSRTTEAVEYRKLIESLMASYNIVYTVNMDDDSFRLLRMDDNIVGYGEKFDNFSQAKDYFINNVIHSSDCAWMRRELDYGTIRRKLAESKSYQIEYRAIINGAPLWHEMKVTSIDKDRIAIGFAVRDLEIMKRHLEDKRFEEYMALFIIDIDTETIKPIKTSPLFKTVETGTAVPYGPAMKQFAAIYDGDAKDLFERISDIQYLKLEFATDDKRTASYKSVRLASGKWIDVTAYTVDRHTDGSPAAISLGFSLVDSLTTQRKEMQRRMTSDMQMIGGLASGYHALYLFNIDENFFRIYSLDYKRQPEAAKIVEKGGDPMETFRKFIVSDMVHPDDRHLFEVLSVESIREKLAHSKKFSVRFRRKFGKEYLWTEMDVIKNEEIDEQANAIVVGFAMRDSEIRSEQTLKECYSVLGNGMPPQEAIDRLMALAGDYYGGDRAYIFEFDKSKDVYRNTFEWCKEGIEPMISKLQNVSSREVGGWIKEFERHGVFYMNALDTTHTTEEGVAILEMQGIESVIAAPVLNGDEIVGFIGVDNPTRARHHLGILKSISVVAYSEILQQKENDEGHITLQKLTDTFLSVYYVDLESDYMHNWKIDEQYKEYGAVKRYSESMGGYVREKIAVRDRERCIRMTSPEYVLKQFRARDRFSIGMTDIMLGYERDIVFDYVKVSDDGNRLVICCRDMTESLAKERQQQQQLEAAFRLAETANKSKTDFLFNMSHDIRTPMNAITGFTAMAKKYATDPEKVTDYLDKIDLAGQQLLMLINQVLEMSRIESGKIELDETPVNIRENYNALVTILAEQAKENGLEFHHTLGDIKHYNIYADDARMSQITLNIAGNAIKYTPSGGKVDFSLKEIPCGHEGFARYEFTVSDTGIGMSQEFQKILFQPFAREKNSTVSKIQGTGLGMSIVKSLVDLMGGTIHVQSEPGKGTTFDVTIELKIDTAEEKTQEKPFIETDMAIFKGRHVLLVEDNELNREIAKFILEDQGMIVDEAEDGDIAVDSVRKFTEEGDYRHYDFIIMDVQMPRMSGYEATARIRELLEPHGIHVPIIAMTANAFEEDRQDAIFAGMDDHLSKPINVRLLWEKLAKFIQQ